MSESEINPCNVASKKVPRTSTLKVHKLLQTEQSVVKAYETAS